jgi:hypothetical protein
MTAILFVLRHTKLLLNRVLQKGLSGIGWLSAGQHHICTNTSSLS